MKVGGVDDGRLPDRLPRDVGLQPERTALAWNRTALVMLANGVLALRTGWSSSQTAMTALALSLLLASGAILAYGATRRHHLLNGLGRIAPPTLAIASVAAITFVACVAEIASLVSRLDWVR